MHNKRYKIKIKKSILTALAVCIIQSSIYTGNISFATEEKKATAPTKTEQKVDEKKETKSEENAEEEKTTEEKPANETEETKPEETKEIEETEENANIANMVGEELKTISNDAVYQIEIGYEFDDGSFDMWAQGSGFLITNKDILTTQTLTDTTTTSNLYKRIVKERSEAYKRIGVSLSNEKEVTKGIKVFVTNTRGEKIEATNILFQNGMGVITLPKVSATETAIFQDANKVNKSAGQEVSIKFDGKDDALCDVQSVNGVIEENENKDVKSFIVTADTSNGYVLGAPVINEEGNIIGLVSSTASPMTIIPNDAIETYLISNGIKYKTVLSLQKEEEAKAAKEAEEAAKKAEEAIVDKTPLENKIKEIEELDLKNYTKETIEALDASIENGKKLLDSKDITKDQVRVAVEEITTAQEALKEKGFIDKITSSSLFLPIVIGVVGIVLILFVFAVIAKGLRKKKEKENEDVDINDNSGYSEELSKLQEEEEKRYRANQHKYQEDYDDRYPSMVSKGSDEVYNEELDVTQRTAPKNLRVPRNVNVEGVKYADTRYSETDGVSNLNNDLYKSYDEGDEGTTFLNENELPSLVRLDTGERFKINDGFIIGKQKSKVDYCITGNTTISRTHASIRKIKGEYYIEDLSSKNYTYLNGNQIAEYKPALLEDGALIRLSDVEFTYEAPKR